MLISFFPSLFLHKNHDRKQTESDDDDDDQRACSLRFRNVPGFCTVGYPSARARASSLAEETRPGGCCCQCSLVGFPEYLGRLGVMIALLSSRILVLFLLVFTLLSCVNLGRSVLIVQWLLAYNAWTHDTTQYDMDQMHKINKKNLYITTREYDIEIRYEMAHDTRGYHRVHTYIWL